MRNITHSVSLSTDCTCPAEELTVNYSGEPSPNREEVVCSGFCYLDARDELQNLLDSLTPSVIEHNAFLVKYLNVTWQGRDGQVLLPFDSFSHLHNTLDAEKFLDHLRINDSYRLEIEMYDDCSILVVRYSHDEPTGACFTFIPTTASEESHTVSI